MLYWLKLTAILLGASLLVMFVIHYRDADNRYARISAGMPAVEVQTIMGRRGGRYLWIGSSECRGEYWSLPYSRRLLVAYDQEERVIRKWLETVRE
jgi:hypothetical protein